MLQAKEEYKISEKELSKKEICNCPDKELKEIVIMILSKFKRRMELSPRTRATKAKSTNATTTKNVLHSKGNYRQMKRQPTY